MRVETVEILSQYVASPRFALALTTPGFCSIAQKSLTEPLLNALRLWSTTTHPYAVAQQWEHALDTLAIRTSLPPYARLISAKLYVLSQALALSRMIMPLYPGQKMQSLTGITA